MWKEVFGHKECNDDSIYDDAFCFDNCVVYSSILVIHSFLKRHYLMKINRLYLTLVRITSMCLLYMVSIFSSLAITRYHQDSYFEIHPISATNHIFAYYILLVICSVIFFLLTFFRGLDSQLKKGLALTYIVTLSTILILYKIPLYVFSTDLVESISLILLVPTYWFLLLWPF